ncbi:MAG: EamA family transporter [Rhodobacteraceae bacterium]|nr:EamA family transporter [Paracoccaceae bacterium]
METPIFFAVLFSALLHASWNAVIRAGGDRFQGMLLLTVSQGFMGLCMALFVPLPNAEVWLWLLASGVLHAGYKMFLAAAYKHGDLSRVYPIARGVAPMIVVLAGYFLLSDTMENKEYAGIALIGVGVVLMAQGVFSSGEARVLIPFALGSALCTAGYSMVDGLGARVAGNATQFTAWIFIFDALVFSTITLASSGPRRFIASRKSWMLGSFAGALSLVTYWITVWAMTVAPIALVAALRETSVLFAVLIGVFLMKERAEFSKLIAAIVVVSGIILIRI